MRNTEDEYATKRRGGEFTQLLTRCPRNLVWRYTLVIVALKLKKWRQEDKKFKVILSKSLKPAWATGGPVTLSKKKDSTKEGRGK